MPSTKGGTRSRAGRKPNVETRITREVVERVAASGVTPLEAMVQIMHASLGAKKYAMALRAAMGAAPYMHPRLAAVQHKVALTVEKRPEQMSDAEIQQEIAALMTQMAQAGCTMHISPEGGYVKDESGTVFTLPGTVVPGAAA